MVIVLQRAKDGAAMPRRKSVPVEKRHEGRRPRRMRRMRTKPTTLDLAIKRLTGNTPPYGRPAAPVIIADVHLSRGGANA